MDVLRLPSVSGDWGWDQSVSTLVRLEAGPGGTTGLLGTSLISGVGRWGCEYKVDKTEVQHGSRGGCTPVHRCVCLSVFFCFLLENFIEYSWFTVLCSFQVYSKAIQLYIHLYLFFSDSFFFLIFMFTLFFSILIWFFSHTVVREYWVVFPVLCSQPLLVIYLDLVVCVC